MEKEFIPYEQSLDLKELGFDELCIAYYDQWVNTNNEVKQTFRIGEVKGVFDSITPAPTFSQAFRWFREKYELFYSVTEYNKDGSLIIEISKHRVEIFKKMTNFDITEYEEAELACLIELIEIVKNEINRSTNTRTSK